MALVIADRVRETTTTSGTGTITLAGAYTGFQAFSVIGNGNTTYYAIVDAQTGSWEVGVGTYTLSGTTLSRDTVLASSNSGSLVNFASGTKDVICTQPAERAVFLDSATNATIPGITLSGGTANGVAYLNGSKVLTSGSALTFDGARLTVSGAAASAYLNPFELKNTDASGYLNFPMTVGSAQATIRYAPGIFFKIGPDSGDTTTPIVFALNNGSEQMRLTSTGLGIGTSSPGAKLSVDSGGTGIVANFNSTAASGLYLRFQNSGTSIGDIGAGGQIVSGGAAGDFGITSRSGNLLLGTGSTTRATLDSSGNLGLGVTPSAWNSAIKAFQIGAGVSLESRTSNYGYMALSANQYINSSGTPIYLATDAATKYEQANGVHRWSTAPSGTAGNTISFTQAMTLDASGFLGVGETSPTSRIHVNGTIQARTGATGVQIYGDGGSGYVNSVGANPLIFQVNSTERARIDSSGNLLVGTTTVPSTTNIVDGMAVRAPFSGDTCSIYSYVGTGGNYELVFLNSNGLVGSITTSGSGTTYATSSDYRLKEDIQPMTGALAKVAALKPCTYKWKADGSDGEGFIAHELAEVAPQCVAGEKDAVDEDGNPVYQGIDTSFLVATLTAALQEAHGLIKDLQARVNALEAK